MPYPPERILGAVAGAIIGFAVLDGMDVYATDTTTPPASPYSARWAVPIFRATGSVIVRNPSEDEASITLTMTDEAGDSLDDCETTIDVPANGIGTFRPLRDAPDDCEMDGYVSVVVDAGEVEVFVSSTITAQGMTSYLPAVPLASAP